MIYTKLIANSLLWKFLVSFSAFVLAIFIARIFGPAGSGAFNLFITGAALVVSVATLNVDSSVIYFSSSKEISPGELRAFSIFFLMLSSGIVLCMLVFIPALRDYLFLNAGGVVNAWIYITGLQLTMIATAFFYGQKNFVVPGLIITLFNCLQIFVLIGGYLLESDFSIAEFLPYFLFTPLIQGIVLAILYYRKFYSTSIRYSLSLASSKRLVGVSFIFFITNILWFLLYRVDYWMLVALDSSADQYSRLGNYIQASKIGQLYLVFSSAIGTVIFSTGATMNSAEQTRKLSHTVRYLLLIGTFSYLLFILVGKWILLTVYGSLYADVYGCCLLLIPGIIAMMAVSVTANYFASKGIFKYNLVGILFALAVLIAGNYYFIPMLGIYAASAVSSMGYFIYSFFMAYKFCRHTGSDMRNFFILQKEDIHFVKDLKNTIKSKMKL